LLIRLNKVLLSLLAVWIIENVNNEFVNRFQRFPVHLLL